MARNPNLKFVSGPGDLIIYKKDPDKASEIAEAATDTASTREENLTAQKLHEHAANRHLEAGNPGRAADHQEQATKHAITARSQNN